MFATEGCDLNRITEPIKLTRRDMLGMLLEDTDAVRLMVLSQGIS